MNEWNLQGRAHACQTCGQPFADQQPYHTLLFDDRNDYRRLDVCPACWETRHRDNDVVAKGFISHWQGVYEAPPPAPEPIQKDTAESLLRKLIERDDPRYAPAGYILAVMLERKRLLKVKEQLQREDRRVFVYEQPRTGDLFTIADPDLRLDQLDEVQRDVAMLLEHGLPDPTAEPSSTSAPDKEATLDGPPSETAVAPEDPIARETEENPVAAEGSPVENSVGPVVG